MGAVLRVDVKDLCEGSNDENGASGGYTGCGATASTGSTAFKDSDTGVIYFPVSYSEEVVESFGTINIRESIETSDNDCPIRYLDVISACTFQCWFSNET